jgi:hypothetical protein
MPNAACPTATGISSFTERLSYMGPVRVWRQSGTSKQQLQVRAGGGGGIALMHARNAATLSAQVHLSVPNWQLPGANPIPAYFISGGYTATALEIPTPVQLTESAADASGMRRYSLSTLHGLEFVNPTEPYYWDFRRTPNVSWRFIPDRGTPKRLRDECDDNTVCTYKPDGPGTMEVTTYVEGQQVIVRGSGVQYVPPELLLTCNAVTITRGDDIACSVSATSGTPTEIQWTFVDSLGHTIRSPSGVADWGGKMVIGGRMNVSAKIDGQPASVDTPIVVGPRTWRTLRTRTVEDASGLGLPAPAAVAAPEHLGNSAVGVPSPYPIAPIDAGPNTGWTYLDNEPVLLITVQINGPAFQHGSAWARLQTGGTYTDPVTRQRGRYCSRSDLPDLMRLTREHEGSLSGSTTSHADAARTWLRNNRRESAVEKLVVFRPSLTTNVEDAYDKLLYGAVLTAVNRDPSVKNHTSDDPPGLTPRAAFPCAARPWR